MYVSTYTFDCECANVKVSKRHHRCSGDSQLLVWSLKVVTNIVSPVLFTLVLQWGMKVVDIMVWSDSHDLLRTLAACYSDGYGLPQS